MAKITVNGEAKDVALPVTVSELIKAEGVEQPDMVSVQVNGDFLMRDEYDSRVIAENDEIDFLYFMGGGGLNQKMSLERFSSFIRMKALLFGIFLFLAASCSQSSLAVARYNFETLENKLLDINEKSARSLMTFLDLMQSDEF